MRRSEVEATFTILERLCECHATPGDEGEVFDALTAYWQEQELQITRLGNYAVYAHGPLTGRPILLLTAHADSPGFAVAELPQGETPGNELQVVTLGSPHLETDQEGVLKTATGRYPVMLHAPGEEWRRSEPLLCTMRPEDVEKAGVRAGDRICWKPGLTCREGGVIASPFLDNRLGCTLLAMWFETPSLLSRSFDVVVGVTALEEMNGFGAAVLARQLSPAVAVALDATYASVRQQVVLGHGPVLTLSDASVVLSPATRDTLMQAFREVDLPLQLEVYNYSGTDAKAFPQQGLNTQVLALLLPTGGNHSSEETAQVSDFKIWRRAIETAVQALPGTGAGSE